MNATSSSIRFTSRSVGSPADRNKLLHGLGRREESPTKNSSVATTNEARYLARYRPNGWSPSVLRLEKRPPHHQYDFVGAIRDGMYRLGKHGGRSGEERREQLRDGDTNVRAQRRLDGRA